MLRTNRILLALLFAFMLGILSPLAIAGGSPRLITVIADKDNLFKIAGQKLPVIHFES